MLFYLLGPVSDARLLINSAALTAAAAAAAAKLHDGGYVRHPSTGAQVRRGNAWSRQTVEQADDANAVNDGGTVVVVDLHCQWMTV